MMDFTDTHQLITAILDGSQEATEQLIQNHQAGVYRLALSILDDPAEASEAAQDVFLAAVNGLDSYQHLTSFKAWLYTITVNTCRSRLRKAKARLNLKNRLQNVSRIEAQGIPTPEEQAIRDEKDAVLWKAIGRLSDRHRIPLVLRYFNDFSISEIAEILGLPEGTIHSRLHIARERLRLALEKERD